jgi:hypothetical protein
MLRLVGRNLVIRVDNILDIREKRYIRVQI